VKERFNEKKNWEQDIYEPFTFYQKDATYAFWDDNRARPGKFGKGIRPAPGPPTSKNGQTKNREFEATFQLQKWPFFPLAITGWAGSADDGSPFPGATGWESD
jgi:hypothetical protein